MQTPPKEKGETIPPPTVEQAQELVRANEGRDLTPQERFSLILANGQSKLEQLGVPTETAQKMLANVILGAGSKDSLAEVRQMLNDENHPSTYKDGDILAATQEYAEAIRATQKTMTPEHRKQVYDIRDAVQERALEQGYSEDEAEAAAQVHEAFAQLAYQMSGEAPADWYKRNQIEFRDLRKHEEDTSFDFGQNAQQPQQEYDIEKYGLPDGDIVFQPAYHGTPHRFDKFSLENVGGGEGHQAHGWGLYFTASKKVGEEYRLALSQDRVAYDGKVYAPGSLENLVLRRFEDITTDFEVESFEEAKEILLDSIADGIFSENPEENKYMLEFAKGLDTTKIKMAEGQLYEVDIPDSNVLLDEQELIAKQTDFVQEAVSDLLMDNGIQIPYDGANMTGRRFYKELSDHLGGDKEASQLLDKYGIKGITYNGRQDGRCYVIFNADSVDVLDTFYQQGWHGTPHDFEQFDLSKIGTGEGMQAHGWGVYISGSKKTAEGYRQRLTGSFFEKRITYLYDGKPFYDNKLVNRLTVELVEKIATGKKSLEDVKKQFQNIVNKTTKDMERVKSKVMEPQRKKVLLQLYRGALRNEQKDLDALNNLNPKLFEKKVEYDRKGKLYRVDIPPDGVLLDEEKGLEEQPRKVNLALGEVVDELAKQDEDYNTSDAWGIFETMENTGRAIYWELVAVLEDRGSKNPEKDASLLLNKHGIKGIKYNGRQDGRCYVIFDEKAITILDKYYQEENAPLGQTQFTDTGAIITLLEGANKTTLLHELGHVFLRDFERVAAENDNAITRHYTEVIEGFLGKKQGTRWNREQQEKFARTFLEYVRTKDVPEQPEMRTIFDRFKDWLQEIYEAIDGTRFFEKNVSQEAKEFFNEVLAPQAIEVPQAKKFRGKIRELRQAVEDIRHRRLPRVETGLVLKDIKALYEQTKRRIPKAPQTDLLRELRRFGANYERAAYLDKEVLKNKRIPNKKEYGSFNGDEPALWLMEHGYMGQIDSPTYEAQSKLNEEANSLIERALNGDKVYRLDDQEAVEKRANYKEDLEIIKEVSDNLANAQEVLRNINEMERKGYRALDRDDLQFLEDKIKVTEKLADSELDKLEEVKTAILDEINKRIDAEQLEKYLARISAAKNKEALEAAARRTMLAIEKCYTNRALYTQHLLPAPRQTATLKDLQAAWNMPNADETRATQILAKQDGILTNYLKDAFVSISDRLRRVDKELARKIEDLPRKRVMRNSRYRQYFGDYIAFIYKYVAPNEEDFELLSWAQMNGNEVAEKEIADKYKDYKINNKTLVQLISEKNEGLKKIWEEGVNAGLSIGWLEGYNPRRMANSDGFIEFLQGLEEWSHIDRVLKIMGVDQGTSAEKAMAINKYFRGFEPKDLAATSPGNIRRRDIMYVTKPMSKFYKNSFEALVDYADDMAKAISIKETFGINESNLENSVGKLVLEAKERYRLSYREERLLKDAITAFVRPAKASQLVRSIKTFSYLTTITNFVSTLSQLEDIGFAMAVWGHGNTLRALGNKVSGNGWIKLEQIGAEVFDVDMRKEREGGMDKGLRKLLGLNGFSFMDRLGKETYVNTDFQSRQKMAQENPEKLQKELEGLFAKEQVQEVITALKEGNLNNENLQSLLYYDLSAVQPMSLLDMPERYALGGGGYKLLYQLKSFAARRANYLYTRTQEQFHNAKTPEEYAKAIAETVRFFTLLIGYGTMTNLLKDFLMGRTLDITDELLDTILQNAMVTRFMIKRGKQDPMNALVNAVVPPAFGTANDLWQDTGRIISGKKDISQMNIWSRLPVIGKPYYWWFGGGRAITEKDNKEKGLFRIKGWAGK